MEKYNDPHIQALLDMASTVDPHFKMRYLAEDNKTSIQTRLKDEMQTVAMMVPPPEPAQENTEEDAEAGCAPKKKMTLGSNFKTTEQALPSNNQEPSVACELQSYLQSCNLDSEGDPLKRWKEHEKVYPRLSKVAKKYLCIPATSSPSERAFSTAGNVQ